MSAILRETIERDKQDKKKLRIKERNTKNNYDKLKLSQ
jgi:hypothetical protein